MHTELTYLLNTHNTSHDILDIHLNYLHTYLPSLKPTICTNKREEVQSTPHIQKIIEYDNNLHFTERIRQVISSISTKYVLFAMDNNILVDYVSPNFLEDTLQFMEKHNADQVRFSPIAVSGPVFESPYHTITGGYYMSYWPSLWKTSSLLQVYETFRNMTYRTLECDEVFSFIKNNFSSFYVRSDLDLNQNTDRVVSYHYPMIHLTRSGQWYTSHYESYIRKILDEFNIDINQRGIFVANLRKDF